MVMAGGGQGIGRAFAHALGEAGAAIAVVDINGEKAEAVRDELTAKGVRAIAITADITKASVCTRCKDNSGGIRYVTAVDDTVQAL